MFSRFFAPLVLLALVGGPAFSAPNSGHGPRNSDGATVAQSQAGADQQAAFQAAENTTARDAAIAAYKKFIKDYPASPLASKAQFRVAQLLEEAGNLPKAFDAYQTLLTRYPDTPEFEEAVARQVLIANQYLQGKRLVVLGWAILPGTERAQQMYQSILKNAPFSKFAPVAQFNLGLSNEKLGMLKESQQAYQTVMDKYPTSDIADDALYQIGYIYMRAGISGKSQDLSSLVLAKETFEDFIAQYPKSEKVAQAKDNLAIIGNHEASDLMRIAHYYDWKRNYKAAAIYYGDVIRKQPKTADATLAKTRIEELRSGYGEDALRVGSEKAESGEQLALRRRLQAQVETSALADYNGPPKRDIVPDELPVSRTPKLRTNMKDAQPLPASVEPLLPTQ